MFEDETVFHRVCSELTAAISGILIAKGATAATAESLTGGLIASEIVSIMEHVGNRLALCILGNQFGMT